ncbi:MAG: exodeoxyribonuclease VII small subunit [Planctomycetes bacterium]|nr:exodeoxyribonuclease VII small subunit [Planctomycetota bacterium]
MASKKTSKTPRIDPKKLSFEKAVAELELIIERIEQGEVGLEESLDEYRRGAQLITRCRDVLDVAQQQIEKISAQETAD